MELEVLKWLIFSGLGLAMWFLKTNLTDTKDHLKTLQSEIQNIKQEYLLKEDFREFKGELRGMFEDIRRDIRSLKPHEKD